MKPVYKEILWSVVMLLGLLVIFSMMPAEASDRCYKCTINYITEVTEVTEVTDMTITGGLTDEDAAKLLTTAATAGGHQFDFSTQDWQGSIVGAWYDDENAVSFGAARRFDKLGKALFHGSYTQNGSESLWVFGGTFRF